MKTNLIIVAIAAGAAIAALHTTASVRASAPQTGGAPQTAPPQTTKSVWDGVYTDEQATRGKTGYAEQGNIGIQQEVPKWAMVFKAAYVTNLARQVD